MTANLKPTMRLLALASALLVLPPAAQAAAAVSLTAAEALGTAGGPGTNVMNGNANGGDFFRSNSVGADSAFFHTYGTSGGVNYFGARVSGTGTFFGKTSATYTDSITNNTGVAQMVVFSFHVDNGNIGMSGTGDGYADLLLSLKFGSDVVARDHGRITYSSSVGSCNSNVGGQDVGVLASYLSCDSSNSATGNAGSYSASQLLGVGATLNVTYDIVAEVSGTLSGTPRRSAALVAITTMSAPRRRTWQVGCPVRWSVSSSPTPRAVRTSTASPARATRLASTRLRRAALA